MFQDDLKYVTNIEKSRRIRAKSGGICFFLHCFWFFLPRVCLAFVKNSPESPTMEKSLNISKVRGLRVPRLLSKVSSLFIEDKQQGMHATVWM